MQINSPIIKEQNTGPLILILSTRPFRNFLATERGIFIQMKHQQGFAQGGVILSKCTIDWH